MLPWPLVVDRSAMLADTNQQTKRPICARICARDMAGQDETGETQKTREDFMPHVCRGQRGNQRQGEPAETNVVWLITQRSRVQIPPPLLVTAGQGPFPTWERAFCMPGTVARRVAETGLRAARQRDGGDGV